MKLNNKIALILFIGSLTLSIYGLISFVKNRRHRAPVVSLTWQSYSNADSNTNIDLTRTNDTVLGLSLSSNTNLFYTNMTDFHIEGINTNNLLLFKDNNYNILKEDSQKVFTVFSQGQDLFAFKMDSNYVIESFTAFREPIVKNNGTNWTITFK